MIASEIAICKIPFISRLSSWHAPRITCTKTRDAARFLSSSSLSGTMASLCGGYVHEKGARVLSPGMERGSMSTELLVALDDEYNGVVVDPASLPTDADAFGSQLRASLGYWRSKGKKGIWLKLFEEQAHLVPVAIQEGFEYHDAEAGYVMLTYWIPGEPCLLPSGPSHQIGIAAFVIDHNNQVLVVKEKCSCSCCGVWKLPTGFIDKYEELFSGAVREVKEETGVTILLISHQLYHIWTNSHHRSIQNLYSWHVHRVAFERSDLLFVCMLNPLSLDIQIDENEIQDAKWISVDELLNQQFYREDEMLRRAVKICLATYQNNHTGFVAHQVVSKFDGKMSYLYYKDVLI